MKKKLICIVLIITLLFPAAPPKKAEAFAPAAYIGAHFMLQYAAGICIAGAGIAALDYAFKQTDIYIMIESYLTALTLSEIDKLVELVSSVQTASTSKTYINTGEYSELISKALWTVSGAYIANMAHPIPASVPVKMYHEIMTEPYISAEDVAFFQSLVEYISDEDPAYNCTTLDSLMCCYIDCIDAFLVYASVDPDFDIYPEYGHPFFDTAGLQTSWFWLDSYEFNSDYPLFLKEQLQNTLGFYPDYYDGDVSPWMQDFTMPIQTGYHCFLDYPYAYAIDAVWINGFDWPGLANVVPSYKVFNDEPLGHGSNILSAFSIFSNGWDHLTVFNFIFAQNLIETYFPRRTDVYEDWIFTDDSNLWFWYESRYAVLGGICLSSIPPVTYFPHYKVAVPNYHYFPTDTIGKSYSIPRTLGIPKTATQVDVMSYPLSDAYAPSVSTTFSPSDVIATPSTTTVSVAPAFEPAAPMTPAVDLSGITGLLESIKAFIQSIINLLADLMGTLATKWSQMIGLLQSILSSISGFFTDCLSLLQSISQALAKFFDVSAFTLDFTKLKAIDLTSKFPFCIPFDFIKVVKTMSATPSYVFNLDLETAYFQIHHTVDLSRFNTVLSVWRFGCRVTFALILVFVTRKLIKW